MTSAKDNNEIGKYLSGLIDSKYESRRKFCAEWLNLEKAGQIRFMHPLRTLFVFPVPLRTAPRPLSWNRLSREHSGSRWS